MRRRWFRALFRRRMLIILLLIQQALFIVYMVVSGSRLFHTLRDFLTIISVITALHVVAKKDKGAYKAVWISLSPGIDRGAEQSGPPEDYLY